MNSDPELMEQARRAYERGRLTWATPYGLPVLFVVPMAWLGDFGGLHALVLTLMAALASVGLAWRTNALGVASLYGAAGGAMAAWTPHLMGTCGAGCGGMGLFSWCMICCAGGGFLAGTLILVRSGREPAHRLSFALSAGLVATLVGSVGCWFHGTVGLSAMAAAVIVCLAPVVALPRAMAS